MLLNYTSKNERAIVLMIILVYYFSPDVKKDPKLCSESLLADYRFVNCDGIRINDRAA